MIGSIAKKLMHALVRLFFFVYFLVLGKPKLSFNIQKTLKLYKVGDFSELFALIRVWDAPFEIIEKLTPDEGTIVDLGCGDGFLVNYLGLAKPKRELLGIEIDKDRIKEADKKLKNTKFINADILKTNIPIADSVLLVHVLHHLSSHKDQKTLLEKIQGKLKKGGKLIIAEVAEKPTLKYYFSWVTDAITVPILFENKLFSTNFFYRKEKEWRQLLQEVGFKVKTKRAHKGKPFSHIIIECLK